jgi:UDP:flavonoid glycosyltransferase YjiC (YdhE family)
MLALGSSLVQRGHDVTFETWERWRGEVVGAGMEFVPAPEYPVFPTRERPLQPYQAVALATKPTRAEIAARRPDVVVHDILTLAPALAAELEGVPTATLVPHIYPVSARGFPPYATGARLPRTAFGRGFWGLFERPLETGLRLGQRQLNETRRRVGLPAQTRLHGGISARLCLVGTFPQLEYPRVWPAGVHVVGPMLWEPAATPLPPQARLRPPGDGPLVVVAPSTSHDQEQRLLRASLTGLRGTGVRVLAATDRRASPKPIRAGLGARLVSWLSYADVMPEADLVVCHAGHGTLARALAAGVPVLAVPHSGDMAENAARLDWAGAGVRLPWRLLSPTTLRLAAMRALGAGGGLTRAPTIGGTEALLRPGSPVTSGTGIQARAGEIAAWAAVNDGPTRAAELIEQLAE